MNRSGQNRRRDERLRLSNPVIARLGSEGVVLIDISMNGARIEHYVRFDRGSEKTLRLHWHEESIAIRCRVMSCRVQRFSPGDDGLTVYESGLAFEDAATESRESIKRMIEAYLAGSLVEQVANAKGFVAPTKGDMPIFRGGMLTSNRLSLRENKSDSNVLPEQEIVRNVGFVCFSLNRGRWGKKWTMRADQPNEGFTVSASEPALLIDDLCYQYIHANMQGRHLIRLFASLSVSAAENATQSSDLAPNRLASHA